MAMLKNIFIIVSIVYLIGSCWYILTFFKNSKRKTHSSDYVVVKRQVNIWGKAAIAEYFWLHIFEGDLQEKSGFLLSEGHLNIEGLDISYLTGPSLIPATANKDVVNLVIILNGRSSKKVETSQMWLKTLLDSGQFPKLKNLGIVILGNEACENSWLLFYLKNYGEVIKFAFIVYDVSKNDDPKVYQWPLGVATYRNFPLVSKSSVDVGRERKYQCNFLGTVYKGSSRETLYKFLGDHKQDYKCFVKVRHSWQGKETKESMLLYQEILKDSDLTLCPVGLNSESYRIYEAMSYGSVPVLEDVMTTGQCGEAGETKTRPVTAFTLLKRHNAPVIYIKDWNELLNILKQEANLTPKEKMERRTRILDWYNLFRYKMRETFSNVLKHSFEW